MNIEGGNTANIPHFSQLIFVEMLCIGGSVKPFDIPFFYAFAQKRGIFSHKAVEKHCKTFG